MTRRVATPVLAAGLGAVVLAVSLAGLEHARAGGAATFPTPPCAPPTHGNHQIVVEPGHPPVLLYVPPGRPARPRWSLVVVLPGAGMTGADMASYTGYSRLARQRGFMVAYPTADGTRPFWNVSGSGAGLPDDVAYLRHVIVALTGPTACADPQRVGMTGVSNGAGMTAHMACDAADLLAAAVPVAGGYSTLPACEPARPLPILEIHGLRDRVVPYAGRGDAHAGAVGPFLDEWRARDRCPAGAHRSTPTPNVLELRWACADGRIVAHDRVLDAVHGWPGEGSLQPFSSTLRSWRFLNSFVDDLEPKA